MEEPRLSGFLESRAKTGDGHVDHVGDRVTGYAPDRFEKAIALEHLAWMPEEVLERVDQGFGFVSNGTDARMLAAGATASYAKIKAGLAERVPAYRVAGG